MLQNENNTSNRTDAHFPLKLSRKQCTIYFNASGMLSCPAHETKLIQTPFGLRTDMRLLRFVILNVFIPRVDEFINKTKNIGLLQRST